MLISVTGLFMASMQFSIGTLYDTYASKRAQQFHAGLTLAGVALVALALFFEVARFAGADRRNRASFPS